MKIGAAIRFIRNTREMTKETFGYFLDVKVPTVQAIEEDREEVSMPFLIDIANVLNTTVEHILIVAETFKD